MSLTRRFLTSMGIEPEKVDQIIEAHAETVDGLKAEAEGIKGKMAELEKEAEKVQALEKQIEEMKASDPTEEWKSKYAELNAAHEELKAEKESIATEFEAYKADVALREANAEKAELYKAVLREIGLDEKRVAKAARLKDMSELTVEDGALAGREELLEAEKAEWAEFIPQTTVQGQSVPNPPQTSGVEGANPRAVQIAQERHEKLYGKSEE